MKFRKQSENFLDNSKTSWKVTMNIFVPFWNHLIYAGSKIKQKNHNADLLQKVINRRFNKLYH